MTRRIKVELLDKRRVCHKFFSDEFIFTFRIVEEGATISGGGTVFEAHLSMQEYYDMERGKQYLMTVHQHPDGKWYPFAP